MKAPRLQAFPFLGEIAAGGLCGVWGDGWLCHRQVRVWHRGHTVLGSSCPEEERGAAGEPPPGSVALEKERNPFPVFMMRNPCLTPERPSGSLSP